MTAQHYTRNTVSAAHYCPTCGKVTQHRIDDKRKGPCLECIARLDREHEEAAQAKIEAQGEMFPRKAS
jgi:hypothetical protein